ncbi:hypothetical protein V315_01670, partial [Staphylococcus aureus F12915]
MRLDTLQYLANSKAVIFLFC